MTTSISPATAPGRDEGKVGLVACAPGGAGTLLARHLSCAVLGALVAHFCWLGGLQLFVACLTPPPGELKIPLAIAKVVVGWQVYKLLRRMSLGKRPERPSVWNAAW